MTSNAASEEVVGILSSLGRQQSDIAAVADGLHQVDQILASAAAEHGGCAAMWGALQGFVELLSVDGLLRARAMNTARIMLDLDLRSGNGASRIDVVCGMVAASEGFLTSAHSRLGEEGVDEEEASEVLQGAEACLQLVVNAGLRIGQRESSHHRQRPARTVNLSACVSFSTFDTTHFFQEDFPSWVHSLRGPV